MALMYRFCKMFEGQILKTAQFKYKPEIHKLFKTIVPFHYLELFQSPQPLVLPFIVGKV